MAKDSAAHKITTMLTLVALAATVVLGLALRLNDPLSSPAVPAEDPYTHMALVRSHLADGTLEPLYATGTTYPPGLHGVLAAAWVYTGTDLYDLFRVGPAVLGVVGVLGVALLLARGEGLAAGLTGAMAMAVAPEAIFRTTMMAPTALDLAILPFLLYAVLEVVRGRWAWLGVAVPVGLFLIFAHPWVLGILGPATLVLAVLALLLGRHSATATATATATAATDARRTTRPDPVLAPDEARVPASAVTRVAGVGAMLLVSGFTLGIAVFACWEECGLGFQDIDVPTLATDLDRIAFAISGTSIVLGALLIFLRRPLGRAHAATSRFLARPLPATAFATLAAATLLAIVIPAARAGMPEQVDLPRMLGWPILALATLGLVALPYLRTPTPMAGAGLVAATLPFVVHNPFDSIYWPHRTAVYLGLGAVLLAGSAAGLLVRSLVAAWNHTAAPRTSTHATGSGARSAMAGAAATLVVTVAMAGTVYAASPPEYEDGWYRLYPDCEFQALRTIAQAQDPSTIIITSGWEAKLVVAAFAPEPLNVWPSRGFYVDAEHRDKVLREQTGGGHAVLVIVDRYLALDNGDVDTSFLHKEPWSQTRTACDGMGIAHPRITTHIATEADP